MKREKKYDVEKKGILLHVNQKKRRLVTYIRRILPVRSCSCSNVLSYGLEDGREICEEGKTL